MPQYPGHDTLFYAVLNGVVTGPIQGLEQLYAYHITPDTPVWYEGLDDWKPALLAPLTAQYFTPDSPFLKAISQPSVETPAVKSESPDEQMPPIPDSTPAYHEPATVVETQVPQTPAHTVTADYTQDIERPKPYLAWSIVVAVIFNLIFGIIAIVYSAKVRTKFAAGNIEGAQRCSVRAQWWIASGICVGLIFTVARIFTGNLF